MINELSSLSRALEQAGIAPSPSCRTYIPLPHVSAKAPCIRIWVKGGQVVDFEAIDREHAMQLRKFGSNQASFPGLNLISLYRITDESEKRLVAQCIEKPETIDVLQLRALCRENAWAPHQNSRIRNCLFKTPKEMTRLLECAGVPKENLLNALAAECAPFADAQVLHESLTRAAFAKLEKKRDVGLALLILFQPGDARKPCNRDTRNISVFFDTDAYEPYGMYAASGEFTAFLNAAFLQAERILTSGTTENVDSFGENYVPTHLPMPKVKLAAGFEPALYTMFDGQPCQNRYHNFDDKRDSYPLSAQHRVRFQAALHWLGGEAGNKGVTWLNTGKGEAVFAYPSSLPDVQLPYVQFFGRVDQSGDFGEISQNLLTALGGLSPKERPERVQVFVLRKMDKGRTKLLYSQAVSAAALKHAAESWEAACNALPAMPSTIRLSTPFPIDVAAVVNRVWRQSGEASTVDELNEKGTGSTFKAIGRKILEETDIPLPDLPTQRRIAATLDKVSEGIALCKQMLTDLDELVKSQFVEMFGDKDYPMVCLSDVADISSGLTKNANRPNFPVKMPYLRVANVFFNRLDLSDVQEIGLQEKEVEKTLLMKDDLLFVEGNGSS